MRGLGDFQRRQMRKGDPRVREAFSRIRQLLDLFEDIVNHPYLPAASAPPPPPPTPPPTSPQSTREVEPLPLPAPLLVTVKEARRLIGISNSRLYTLINEGRLETVLLGKRRLIRYGSLQQLASTGTRRGPVR